MPPLPAPEPASEPDPDYGSPLRVAAGAQARAAADDVRAALDRGDVELWRQPVVSARRRGRVAFHEGLVRLRDETGRIIPARDFVHRVEDSELGRRIDCAALALGLADLAAEPDLRLSVNMSARSIGYPAWRETLERGIAARPTVAERLILEIAESSAMLMPEVVAAFMRPLQARGVAFALDGFGAGLVALRHLRDFPFDAAKIDGEFVRGLPTNPDNQALVRALAAVAREFGMFTVGMAVETEGEAAALAEAGVDLLQGYLVGMPAHPRHRAARAAVRAAT
jgi:EAL domain-containing protein (putative c-di-GMP-specific phosphodiesterase class I)